MQSLGGLLRLPLAENGVTLNAAGKVVGLKVRGLAMGDRLSIIAYGQRDPRLERLLVKEIGATADCIFVPAGYLVYPGNHEIEMSTNRNPVE